MRVQSIGVNSNKSQPDFKANYILYSKDIKSNLCEKAIAALKEFAINRAVDSGIIRPVNVGKKIYMNDGIIIVPDISIKSGKNAEEIAAEYKRKAESSSVTSADKRLLNSTIMTLLQDNHHAKMDYLESVPVSCGNVCGGIVD